MIFNKSSILLILNNLRIVAQSEATIFSN